MKNKIWVILIVIGLITLSIILSIGLIHYTTPTLEISNIHAEKCLNTWDYTSGKHKESNKIDITCDIDSCRALDDGILVQWIAYDKEDNVIFDVTDYDLVFDDYDTLYYEFDEENNGLNNIDKIVKLELNVYKYIPGENDELNGISINEASFGELVYHGETENITEVEGKNYDVNDIHKETSNKKTGRSYPTESMYNPPQKKDYIVISKPGEPELRQYFHEYVPKWGK